jgi:hypothetical protein
MYCSYSIIGRDVLFPDMVPEGTNEQNERDLIKYDGTVPSGKSAYCGTLATLEMIIL